MLRWWLLIVSVFALLASGCAGEGEGDTTGVAPTTTAVTTTTVVVLGPSTSPTTAAEIEEPEATTSSAPYETTSVPTPGVGVTLPVTGWESVPSETNLWAGEIVALGDKFFLAGDESGPGVERRTGVWNSTDGVTWDDSLVFPVTFGAGPRVRVADMHVVDDHIELLAQRTDGLEWPWATNKQLVVFRTDDQGVSWSESVVHTWGAANFRELAVEPAFAYGDPDVVFAVEGGAGESRGDDTITGTMVWLRDGDGWDFIEPEVSGLAQVWVWAIASTPDGYVALGDTRVPVEGFADCQTQALWTSADGRSWTKVWTNDRDCEWFGVHEFVSVDGDLLAVANENDVVSCAIDDDGGFECPPLNAPVRVFRITDQAIEDLPIGPVEFTDMFLTDVEMEDGVIIALGRTFDATEGRIWLSADAQTWARADIEADDLVNADLFQTGINADGTTIILGRKINPTGPIGFQTWINTSP